MRAALLLTCFNRKDKTLSCLESIYSQLPVKNLELEIYLVDDGSTDGTGDAVAAKFSAVRLLRGDGSLYWNGGMNMAWSAARADGFDAYMWANDDIDLDPDALSVMVHAFNEGHDDCGVEPVIVGNFCETDSGKHTYGGFSVKQTFRGMATKRILPNGQIARCDTFNGNLVLIPNSVVEMVGMLDPQYTHAFGDMDYGLKCMKNNIPMYITPEYLGRCSRNSIKGTWVDSTLPLAERYRKLLLPTGIPPKEYFYSCRKHSGRGVCIIALVKLYLRLLLPDFWARISRKESSK